MGLDPQLDISNGQALTAAVDNGYIISINSFNNDFIEEQADLVLIDELGRVGVGTTFVDARLEVREESATDVAAELTQLIQTQRAYSSNAKVIQTVDEMLQETTNIIR